MIRTWQLYNYWQSLTLFILIAIGSTTANGADVKNADVCEILSRFFIKSDRQFNIYSWRYVGDINGIEWDGDLSVDDVAFQRRGKTRLAKTIILAGPRAGVNWLIIDNVGSPEDLDKQCNGVDLARGDGFYFVLRNDSKAVIMLDRADKAIFCVVGGAPSPAACRVDAFRRYFDIGK